jgi:hypothetical protein
MTMKRPVAIVCAFIALAIMLGMARPPGPEVPTPDIDYHVTVKDAQGISTKLQQTSWEGATYFSGTRGKGSVTIAFGKIKKVTAAGSAAEGKKDFQVTLKSGDVVAVTLDGEAILMGMTSFGTYRITIRDIGEIIFD